MEQYNHIYIGVQVFQGVYTGEWNSINNNIYRSVSVQRSVYWRMEQYSMIKIPG